MRAWTAALIVFVEHMARTTSDKLQLNDFSRTVQGQSWFSRTKTAINQHSLTPF